MDQPDLAAKRNRTGSVIATPVKSPVGYRIGSLETVAVASIAETLLHCKTPGFAIADLSTCFGRPCNDRGLSQIHARLIPHDAVVGEHLGDGRSVRQQPKFLRRAPLELAGVLHDRRANSDDARFKNPRRAGGQQARRDREDGEPPRPASGGRCGSGRPGRRSPGGCRPARALFGAVPR